MNILIVTDTFPPKTGGCGWSTYQLCESLKEKGHKITILRCNSFSKIQRYKQFTIHNVHHPAGKEFVHRTMNKKIKKLIKKEKIDIIHAQHVRSVMASSAIKKTPKVATIRDYWPLFFDGLKFSLKKNINVEKNGFFYTLNNLNQHYKGFFRIFTPFLSFYAVLRTRKMLKALKKMDKIICVSEFVRRTLSKEIDPQKLISIPNIVDIEKNKKFISEKKNQDILFVGKLNSLKGIDVLIKAMKSIHRKLIIVSNWKLDQDLKNFIRHNKIDVQTTGYLDNEKILRLMSENILVIPSIWHEPLGRVHLEALSVGARIITTATGGTPEIIKDGYNGLIFDGTSEDLAKKIKLMIKDKELQKRLSDNALKTAKEKFDKKVLVERYERLYENLIEQR